MKTYSHDCLGSRLDITIESRKDLDSVMTESFLLIDDFENKYSRFIEWNVLSKINREKTWTLPDEIMMLVTLAQKISVMTNGYFDITMLPVLENNGYGIESKKINNAIWYKNIICEKNDITLENDVCIEFGSLGKWYVLDLLYNALRSYSQDFVINFGWDIRVSGEKTIHLEDPNDIKKSIGTIELNNISIASSGWNKRKLSVWHHLINPENKASQEDKIAVFVTHKLWVFADAFATALFVCPLNKSLKILEKTPWLEALIIWADGKIYKSQWFISTLNI